jgi:hypothetical protein
MGHRLPAKHPPTPDIWNQFSLLAYRLRFLHSEAIRSSAVSVFTRPRWRHIPEDDILQVISVDGSPLPL